MLKLSESIVVSNTFRLLWSNPADGIWHAGFWSTLYLVMACYLFLAKSLPVPIHCPLDPQEQSSMKYQPVSIKKNAPTPPQHTPYPFKMLRDFIQAP